MVHVIIIDIMAKYSLYTSIGASVERCEQWLKTIAA